MSESKGLKWEQLVEQWLQTRNFAALAAACLQRELEGTIDKSQAEDVYGLQLVALLLQNDLANARFLWKRIPSQLKDQSKELKALWKVGQALWLKDYPKFYVAVEEYAWSKQIRPFALALRDTTRERLAALIASAYSSISLQACSIMLGLNGEKTVKFAVDSSWRYDQASAMIFPQKVRIAQQRQIGVKQLEQLADYAINLS